MRKISIRTNLVGHKLGRWKAGATAFALAAVGLLVFAAGLWNETLRSRAEAEALRAQVEAASAHNAILEESHADTEQDEALRAWLISTIPQLALVPMPAPAEVLYELEKMIPESVYLSQFEYTIEGVVNFTATSNSRADFTGLASALQGSAVFRKTQIVNQREISPGRFEAQLKLEFGA